MPEIINGFVPPPHERQSLPEVANQQTPNFKTQETVEKQRRKVEYPILKSYEKFDLNDAAAVQAAARAQKEQLLQMDPEYENGTDRRKVVVNEVLVENWQPLLAEIEPKKEDLVERVTKTDDKGGVLNYEVIDGHKVKAELPNVWELGEKLRPFAETLWGGKLNLLTDLAAVNVNVIVPGGEQRLHVDVNDVTLVLYLKKSNGGKIELRSTITPSEVRETMEPEPGRLVALVGANRLLHRVQRVEDGEERMCIVVSYEVPENRYNDKKKNKFFYSSD